MGSGWRCWVARKVMLEVVRGRVTGPWGPTYGARWVDLILCKLRGWCRGLAMKSPELTYSRSVALAAVCRWAGSRVGQAGSGSGTLWSPDKGWGRAAVQSRWGWGWG